MALRITDIYSTPLIAAYMTEAASKSDPFLGAAYFPDKKKMGIDLKWLKSHKGLAVALKPSTFDAIPTIRPRGEAQITKEEMPLFRESIIIKETDFVELARIVDVNDPFLQPVIDTLYKDVAGLVDGADIAAEKMRMQLMAPVDGEVKINVAADDTIYTYEYDQDGTWKSKNYLELTGSDKWNQASTSKPLSDIREARSYLASIGYTATTMIGNSATLELLVNNEQIKNAIITTSGQTIIYTDETNVEDVLQRRMGIRWIPYDKVYQDSDGVEKKFYPDGYVTILGNSQLGNTWRGTTPEELTAIGNFMDVPQPPVDITVLPSGVAVAIQNEYKPSFTVTTTASQIALPSFEGMDSIYVIKVA